METADNFCMVLMTIDNYERARQIARTVVSEQLAACCNIIPGVTSIYSWNNAVNEESEFLVLIKTSRGLLPQMEQRIRELHTYEVPEIISITLDGSSLPYLQWLRSAVQQ